jgi:hypothetical protein
MYSYKAQVYSDLVQSIQVYSGVMETCGHVQGVREEGQPPRRYGSAPQSAASEFPTSEQMIPHGVDSVSAPSNPAAAQRPQSAALTSASGEAGLASGTFANNLAAQFGYGQGMVSTGEILEIPVQREVVPGSLGRAGVLPGRGSAPTSWGGALPGSGGGVASSSGARSGRVVGSGGRERSAAEASMEEEDTTKEQTKPLEGSSAEATEEVRGPGGLLAFLSTFLLYCFQPLVCCLVLASQKRSHVQ